MLLLWIPAVSLLLWFGGAGVAWLVFRNWAHVLGLLGLVALGLAAVWLAFACSERPFPWSDER